MVFFRQVQQFPLARRRVLTKTLRLRQNPMCSAWTRTRTVGVVVLIPFQTREAAWVLGFQHVHVMPWLMVMPPLDVVAEV